MKTVNNTSATMTAHSQMVGSVSPLYAVVMRMTQTSNTNTATDKASARFGLFNTVRTTPILSRTGLLCKLADPPIMGPIVFFGFGISRESRE